MYTTNLSSKESYLTYAHRTREIERLRDIAAKMEILAGSDPRFTENPEFQALDATYRERLRCVLSLTV